MANNIPPRSYYKLTQQEQEVEAVRRMNAHRELAEAWRKLSIAARSHIILEPKEIDRPDLIDLKGENA